MTQTLRFALLAALAAVALALAGCPGGDVCGDGKKTGKEQCDDGNLRDGDGCRSNCTLPATCGNGTRESGEICDDGNLVPGDGCEPDCTATGADCGNGVKEAGEACDDGNMVAGDGCENDCTATTAGCGNGLKEGTEQCDDGNAVGGDGCEANCTNTPKGTCGNNTKEWPEACDDGNAVGGDGCENDCTVTGGKQVTCAGAGLPPPDAGTCTVTPGDQGRLITGIILTPGAIYQGGQVLFDSAGVIQCTGCDCSTATGAATATKVVCPEGVVSPGLINSHDHITFQGDPFVFTDGGTERYEHRHDWRVGHDGHSRISNGGQAIQTQIRWAELRQVMAGTTSVAGSGGQKGFLRNLDNKDTPQADGGSAASQENLGANTGGLNYSTFPLDETNDSRELTKGCAYGGTPDKPSNIPDDAAYLPHIAEGIEASARNEFVCTSGIDPTGQKLLTPRTAIIHGIGMKASDISLAVNHESSLIWSPRSNIDLYGDTAAVPAYLKMNANIALGTDWVRSGSMNLLRELKCADYLNSSFFNKALSDDGLWRLVTVNAANAMQVSSKVGVLAKGKVADIAIFRKGANSAYRAVIAANPEDVVLTVRGGKPLYGDAALVAALTQDQCDAIDVCGSAKVACVKSEIGYPLAQLTTENMNPTPNPKTYPLFFCGMPPKDEPTCTPSRVAPWTVNGSSMYTGMPAADDSDADGVADAMDNCPSVFNPIRPMDNGKQADMDGDGKGDVCDTCPLGAGSTCTSATDTDFDGDGVANATDNCPGDYNVSQADADADQKGDACDFCPADSNPGTAACPATIQQVKTPGSKYVGQAVAIKDALVTATGSGGYFVQADPAATPDYSGLFVFGGNPAVKAGDKVNLTGVPSDYFGQIQLTGATAAVVSSNNPLPAPVAVTVAEVNDTGTRSRALEGVLVKLSTLTVTDINPPLGGGDRAPANEFVVDGSLRVNDYLYLIAPFAELNEQLTSLTGVLELRNDHYKVEPRSLSDFAFVSTALVDFSPATTFARVGYTGPSFPQPLTVKLKRPVSTITTVTVTSTLATDLVVDNGSVAIPPGSITGQVILTGVNANQAVPVVATFGAAVLNASVRVLGLAETGKLVSVTPAQAYASAGGKTTLAVNLDVPAMMDTQVALALSPAGFGTLPAMVTVAAKQTSASFDVNVASGASGSATLTATLGADMATATVNITLTATHVVISELGVGNTDVEFVELYNPTPTAVNASGWQLQYRANNVTSDFQGNGAAFPANTTIAPNGYLLLATTAYASNAANPVKPDLTCSGNFSGTAGIVRVISPAGVVDSIGYGAMVDGGTSGISWDGGRDGTEGTRYVGTIPAAGSIERKANASSTAGTMADGGTDSVAGNGLDSDNNSADLVTRGFRDPQGRDSGTEP